MGREWFDSHCHLDDPQLAGGGAEPQKAIVRRACDEHVTGGVIPGIRRADWTRLAQVTVAANALTADFMGQPGDWHPAYGLHPLYLADHQAVDVAALPAWLTDHKAVAVGECGLDGFVAGLDWREQQRYFAAQLAVARSLDLPVIVHARRALDAVLAQVRRAGVCGVVHSFVGSEQQAKQLIDLGFYLGIGGPVTYPRAQKLRRVVQVVPLSALLLETDGPDQPLCGHQGRVNAPAMVARVGECVAALRGEAVETVAQATRANARRLFRLA